NDRWSSETYEIHPGGETHDSTMPADLAMIERERIARLHAAIAQLPAQAGRVVRLHKIDGMSHRAIADQLAISVSAVEKSMAVAIVHLRRLLGDLR
ncbi:MAG: sigma factor-like helix-turn-helix DNA-binding protein, partial [Sphingomicrobium sp.]